MDLDGRNYKEEFLAFAGICFECTWFLFTSCLLATLPAEQLQYFLLLFFFLDTGKCRNMEHDKNVTSAMFK